MLPFEQGANAVIADDPKLVTFKYFFTRKLMFQKESHAIALFPGGFGTHDEGFEILTLVQTGKSDPNRSCACRPLGVTTGTSWYSFVTDQLLKRRLINEEDLRLFRIVNDVESAVTEIRAFYQTLSFAPICGTPARRSDSRRRFQTEQLTGLHDHSADHADGRYL